MGIQFYVFVVVTGTGCVCAFVGGLWVSWRQSGRGIRSRGLLALLWSQGLAWLGLAWLFWGLLFNSWWVYSLCTLTLVSWLKTKSTARLKVFHVDIALCLHQVLPVNLPWSYAPWLGKVFGAGQGCLWLSGWIWLGWSSRELFWRSSKPVLLIFPKYLLLAFGNMLSSGLQRRIRFGNIFVPCMLGFFAC